MPANCLLVPHCIFCSIWKLKSQMYHHFTYKYFSNYFSHSGFQAGAISILHSTPRDIGNIWGYSGSYSWRWRWQWVLLASGSTKQGCWCILKCTSCPLLAKKIIWPHVSATCMLRNPEYNRVRTTKDINIVLLSQETKQAFFYHQVLFNISIIYLCLFSCFPPNWHNFP